MSSSVIGEAKVKNQLKFMNTFKSLCQMDTILRYLGEGIIYAPTG